MLAALAAGWATGCANQGTPPGGPEDRRPPVIVRTEPDTFAVVEDLRSAVRFHFDERISEQVADGTLEDAVTVSPRTGEVRVSRGSRTLSVEVEGGLQPGVVYRVTVLPVVRDLFGNQLRDPFELVFSTAGATPTPTTLAGEVWDRVSGQGVGGALVTAVGPDSLVHVARADNEGIFAFRYLPAGTFAVTGFEDTNRDGEIGAREVGGSVPATVAAGDTLILEIPVLAPDTTPAVIAGASALDSVTVVLEMDDYLDPAAEVADVDVTLSRESGASPDVSRLFHEHQYAAYVSSVTDSLTAAAAAATTPLPDTLTSPDSAVVPVPSDTLTPGAPADTAGVAPGGLPVPGGAAGVALPGRRGPPPLPGVGGGRGGGRGGQAAGPPGRVLPGRRLVALLDGPLEVEVEYQVRVSSVVNLNGLPGGGGETTLVLEAAPPDTTTVADPVPGDTVPGTQPVPDTVPEPDTTAVPGALPGLGGRRP